MRIFFAATPYNKIFDLLVKHDIENILISYAFYPDFSTFHDVLPLEGWWPRNLIIDSGAFSVWTRNEKIDLDMYIVFCQDFKRKAKKWGGENCDIQCVNLDVLPGRFGERPTSQQREESAELGWQNMEKMLSKGITPIHVFHQHEDFKWLTMMIEKLPYIGISPANDVSMKEKELWLNKVFSIVQTKVKTHGFAVTSHNQVLKYPFYSVDSSSWLSGARYARTPIFSQGKIKHVLHKDEKRENLEHLYNKDMRLTEDYLHRIEEGVVAYKKLNEFANKVWARRNIIHNEKEPSTIKVLPV